MFLRLKIDFEHKIFAIFNGTEVIGSNRQNHKWTESGELVNKPVSAFKLVDSIKLSEIPDSSFY